MDIHDIKCVGVFSNGFFPLFERVRFPSLSHQPVRIILEGDFVLFVIGLGGGGS